MKICQGMIWVILLNIWYIFLQEEKFSASISSTIAVFIFFVFLIQTPIKYMLEPLYPGFLNWFLPEFLNCSSVLFSCSLVSDSLRPHEPQHARPPCPSPIPRVYPNSCPLSWWCHPCILLLPSIFPTIRVFSNELALCIRWPKHWSFSFSIGASLVAQTVKASVCNAGNPGSIPGLGRSPGEGK